MPHHHPLPAAAREDLSPPPERPAGGLETSVSAASVSFVVAGAAVSDLGELLRDLRLALRVPAPRTADMDEVRAAALLAARLETVRWALDGATAAIESLLEDCAPRGAINRTPADRRPSPADPPAREDRSR